MTEQKSKLVEAVQEGVKDLQKGLEPKTLIAKIEFGSLRQKVKKGDLDPGNVLSWYKQQEWQYSKSFVTFLKNQRRKRKTEEIKKKETKKEPNDKQEKRKGKPRRRKRKKQTSDEQS